MRSRTKLWIAAAVLVVIHALALFAGFFAPYDPGAQDRQAPFAPPMRPHFREASGQWHTRPFVYALVSSPEDINTYVEDRTQVRPLYLFVRGDQYRLAGMVSTNVHLLGVQDSRVYLLGTDGFGRDQLSRLLYGGRISLTAGLLAAALALLIGTTLGLFAGFYGGLIDDALMRLSEL